MPSILSPVLDTIHRSNRNRLLLGLAAFGIAAAAVVLSLRYYANLIQGPAPVTFAQILSAPNDALAYGDWVTVEGDEAYDTGFQYVQSGIGYEYVEFSYVLLLMQDRLLLVRHPGEIQADETLPVSYTGELTFIPADIQTEVVDQILIDLPELNDAFFPVLLKPLDYRRGSIIGFSGLGVLLLFAGFNLAVAFRRMSNPRVHPIMQDLSRFGDLDTTVHQIESELEDGSTPVDQFHFTRNWVMLKRRTVFQATRLNDVIWLYPKTVRQRVNGVPVGKRFYVVLHDRYGKLIEHQAKEPVVQEILRVVQQRAPWAITGYSDEINRVWRSDRAKMTAAVDQRRQSSDFTG